MAYFYAARAHRSGGALWPSFAPALIPLRRSVAVHRAGGVVLELCHDELAGSLGGIVAADSGWVYRSQFRESDSHGPPVGFADTIIAFHQSRQRNGL